MLLREHYGFDCRCARCVHEQRRDLKARTRNRGVADRARAVQPPAAFEGRARAGLSMVRRLTKI